MSTLHPPAAEFITERENAGDDPRQRAVLVTGGKNLTDVTHIVSSIAEAKPHKAWLVAFGAAALVCTVFFSLLGYLVLTGIGIWGNNQPVAWAFDIINFVFWIGIGHAGTLISAVLFLFRQNWRTSINRFAEAMTIFAVCCAGIFPALHVGRPWLAYWLFPIPNQMGMWAQYRSPLLWDVFAVSTYASVSLFFWYAGMVPDFATLRDRAKSKIGQFAYGVVSLGWTGSARHWHRFERAYIILCGLCTPLVFSVHSVVSFDFATAQLPGWHTTIFPPYFVAGAIYGGFAMVLTLAIPCRQFFGMKDLITTRHIQNMAKVMLGTGLMVCYSYAMEFFVAWYSGSHFEHSLFLNRPFGNHRYGFWCMFLLNCLGPQLMWFKWARNNLFVIMCCAMCVNAGMWFERYVIIATSLSRDALPSSWAQFVPTWVDLTLFACSFGLFFTLFLLFLKFLPTIAMAEVKTVMPQAHDHSHGHAHAEGHLPHGSPHAHAQEAH